MKRKISIVTLLLVLLFTMSGCKSRDILLFLNWGEYIDESLIEAFEDKYNVSVVMDLGESNEIFYSKVSGGTTVYDVVCPSDYMVEKMYSKGMLSKIDLDLVPTFKKYISDDELMPGVKAIREELENNYKGISDYYVPYLWGTWCMMYQTNNLSLENAILSSANEWAPLFDRTSIPADTKVAMYDSHQHAYYAACRYLGYNISTELNKQQLKQIHDTVKNMNYNAWGTDDIKKNIVAGNLDLGFMWTGDALYYYAENAANKIIEAYSKGDITIDNLNNMINSMTSGDRYYVGDLTHDVYEIGFDMFIPKNTIAFSDNLVITKDANHKDLAHKFIEFMISESVTVKEDDPESVVTPCFSNTYYVSYNAPYKLIYDQLVDLKDYEFSQEDADTFEEEKNLDLYDTTLYGTIYDTVIGIAFDKYYPKNAIKGNVLTSFDRKYVDKINKTFNNARS